MLIKNTKVNVEVSESTYITFYLLATAVLKIETQDPSYSGSDSAADGAGGIDGCPWSAGGRDGGPWLAGGGGDCGLCSADGVGEGGALMAGT